MSALEVAWAGSTFPARSGALQKSLFGEELSDGMQKGGGGVQRHIKMGNFIGSTNKKPITRESTHGREL